ncbi:MAG: hypothetical protein Hals2KO_14550 [Halioglobus sp.]
MCRNTAIQSAKPTQAGASLHIACTNDLDISWEAKTLGEKVSGTFFFATNLPQVGSERFREVRETAAYRWGDKLAEIFRNTGHYGK